jgi:hypothetical protein
VIMGEFGSYPHILISYIGLTGNRGPKGGG